MSSFPNQARNQYRGPGFFDSDFSVNKNFKITERVAFGVGAIAATALEHGLTIVTRNVIDFQNTGAAVLNPWQS